MSSLKKTIRSWLNTVLEFLYRRVPELPPTAATEVAETADGLPTLVVNSNWKLPPSKLPHWLVHNAGPEIENLATALIQNVKREMGKETSAALAGEMQNEKAVHRPLRFLHRLQRGYVSTTDVVLRAEGSDMYVRCLTQPRTLLTYLRFGWKVGMFVAGFIVILVGYLLVTGAKKSWASDYAQKHAPLVYPGQDKLAFMTRRILEGCYVTDWVAFRQALRKKPELVALIKRALTAKAQKMQADIKEAKDLSVIQNMQPMLVLEAAKSIGVYGPDYIGQILIMKKTGDEYAYWWCRDEARPDGEQGINAENFMAIGTGMAAYSSENVRSVKLIGLVANVCSDDEKSHGEILNLLERSTTWHGPWSYARLFLSDPRIALTNFVMPASIIAAVIGFFVWRSPKSWLRYPCKALGWIKPDDFESEALARNARVVRLLSSTLLDAGFPKDAITEVGGGES